MILIQYMIMNSKGDDRPYLAVCPARFVHIMWNMQLYNFSITLIPLNETHKFSYYHS